jgi:hypothetical protein
LFFIPPLTALGILVYQRLDEATIPNPDMYSSSQPSSAVSHPPSTPPLPPLTPGCPSPMSPITAPVRLQMRGRNGVHGDSRRMRCETIRVRTASIVGGVVNWLRHCLSSLTLRVSQITPTNVLGTGDTAQHPNTAIMSVDDPNLHVELTPLPLPDSSHATQRSRGAQPRSPTRRG